MRILFDNTTDKQKKCKRIYYTTGTNMICPPPEKPQPKTMDEVDKEENVKCNRFVKIKQTPHKQKYRNCIIKKMFKPAMYKR